jgi:HPt (histidine-containing phosphotransfer) domain-containing protein
MTEEQVLDAAALARLHDLGGRELVRRMIDLFLDNASKRIEAALEGESAGDIDAIGRAAHSLKSSAGNVGAGVLEKLACRIERLAAEKQSATISALLRDLEKAFEQVKAGLEEAKRGLET